MYFVIQHRTRKLSVSAKTEMERTSHWSNKGVLEQISQSDTRCYSWQMLCLLDFPWILVENSDEKADRDTDKESIIRWSLDMELSSEMTTTLNTPRCQYSHQTRLSFGWFDGLDHDVIMLKLMTIIFALSRYHNNANSKLLTQWPPAAFPKYLGGVRTCHIKVTLTLAQIWRDRARDFSWLLQYFLQTLRCEFYIFVYMQ